MNIEVTSLVIAAMRRAAAQAHPEEACGILLGKDKGEGACITALLPAPNVHSNPKTHFEIDPQTLVDAHRAAREGGPLVLGYFHSHPIGEAHPSATDEEMAAGDGAIWAIAGSGEIRFWSSNPKGFEPLSPSITAR